MEVIMQVHKPTQYYVILHNDNCRQRNRTNTLHKAKVGRKKCPHTYITQDKGGKKKGPHTKRMQYA